MPRYNHLKKEPTHQLTRISLQSFLKSLRSLDKSYMLKSVLTELGSHADTAVSKGDLIERVWGTSNCNADSILSVAVFRLRHYHHAPIACNLYNHFTYMKGYAE
jgi:DNA-binding winged helix-turn-helix (wHTH) protein